MTEKAELTALFEEIKKRFKENRARRPGSMDTRNDVFDAISEMHALANGLENPDQIHFHLNELRLACKAHFLEANPPLGPGQTTDDVVRAKLLRLEQAISLLGPHEH